MLDADGRLSILIAGVEGIEDDEALFFDLALFRLALFFGPSPASAIAVVGGSRESCWACPGCAAERDVAEVV